MAGSFMHHTSALQRFEDKDVSFDASLTQRLGGTLAKQIFKCPKLCGRHSCVRHAGVRHMQAGGMQAGGRQAGGMQAGGTQACTAACRCGERRATQRRAA
eukprot:6199230-Pleurochrysis_carterae.AAC.1